MPVVSVYVCVCVLPDNLGQMDSNSEANEFVSVCVCESVCILWHTRPAGGDGVGNR